MKKLNLLFVLVILVTGFSFAQTEPTDFTGRNPQSDLMNFVPNEILVKFKDNVQLKSGTSLKSAGIETVDQVLKNYEMENLEKLFPTETKLKSVKVVKDPQGRDMVIPSLHNIYKIVLPELKSGNSQLVDIFSLIEELKSLPEIEYTEPNYIYNIDNLQPVGPVLTPSDLEQMQQTNTLKSAADAIIPNDPLYDQQWYIPAIKANLVWAQTTGGSEQVIAILDTGVDTEHPDLKNKIWQNPGEIPGNGIDDDGNGLIDDVNGWDYINNDNDPKDDNSHGTHVAGIAAAETNNGIGIAGVNWQAKIMPLKVFQSSGRGDASTISQGIIYAANKGATAINMSFGSYARSITMENALANAYATSILVAAAGNDGVDVDGCIPRGINFPAALSYVLGVQSPDGSFSNSDCNGPTYSNYQDLFNYELKAPGTNIISTIPNGNYRVYQGTSMATPMVAAAISMYRKLIPSEEETNEFMWVKLIQATGEFLDIHKALTIIPVPEVWFLNKVLVDDCETCDKDGRVDSGETVKLWFRARNTGGQVDSVYWKIQLTEFEEPTTCNITKSTSFIGSISPYASRTSENDPMMIEINPNVVHDRDITFELRSWYKGAQDTLIQNFIITAENGEELSGVMDSTIILTPDKLWLVNNSFRNVGNIIIKPGAKIILNKSIDNRGNIISVGKKDSIISIKGPGSIVNGYAEFKYTNFTNIDGYIGASSTGVGKMSFDNCLFEEMNAWNSPINVGYGLFTCYELTMIDCVIRNSLVNLLFSYAHQPLFFYRNLIDNVQVKGGTNTQGYYDFLFKHNNVSKLKTPHDFSPGKLFMYNNTLIPLSTNNILSTTFDNCYFLKADGTSNVMNVPPQYWGTEDAVKIKKVIYDFENNFNLPEIRFNPISITPTDSAHAIVWKVLVNGKDAQDEIVEPLGVGKHRFDVYFNRSMDKTVTPNVAFGVRYPFSSNTVNENGSWSEDGRIYTVYKTIKLTTGEGINRIRVSDAKEIDGWDWEIPIEDQRFNFIISAASSASNEFMATPGLGKVALEWNDNDLDDGLGYNMYRMEHINDSTLTEPVIINSSLITDTLYSDFSVVPNKKYFYYYKILRTNLTETDSSKMVAAIPFTAALGDANGDLSVNVLDVTTIVAYLLNQNPQPFIFEAADVNGDGQINVLDIVATVNKVLNPGKSGNLVEAGTVNLYLQNDTLFADASVPVGAIQFDITGVSEINEIEKLAAINGFESGFSVKDNTMRLIVYSLTGKTIAAGNRIPLLRLKKGSGITNMIMGDKTGSPLTVNYLSTGLWNLRELGAGVASLGQNYPNPFNKTTTIPVMVNEPVDELVVRIINITGQEVAVLPLKNPVFGENLLHWNTNGQKGMLVYRLEIMRDGKMAVAGVKKMIVNQ